MRKFVISLAIASGLFLGASYLKSVLGTNVQIDSNQSSIAVTSIASAEDLTASSSAIKLARRTEEEQRIIDVYKEAGKAVVFITTTSVAVDPFDFYGTAQTREGSGSGVIVDANRGIIITNLHVIADAQKIEIALSDGKNYKARLLGYDDEFDVAILELVNPPARLHSVSFGDSSRLEVGQTVLAIGNPFGLDRTLTTGIVSSLNRTVKASANHLMRGLIQTDASINPGNSGGPLLDTEGRLIGINSAILSQSGDSAGIGFAVPANQIKRILPELIATGKIARPRYGWVIADTTQGPMIRRVQQGSPADDAGLQPIERYVQDVYVRGFVRDFERADLIVAVQGKEVSSKDQVDELVQTVSPGESIELTVRQGAIKGKLRRVKITPVFQ
jgi:S1-C subfamily serine protease